PFLSLAIARDQARAILREVQIGKDPGAGAAGLYVQRRSALRPGRVPPDSRLREIFPEGYLPGTFGEVAALYLVQHVWRATKAPRHYEGDFKRDLLPRWRDTPASQIDKRQVSVLLGELLKRGQGSLAESVKHRLSAMFKWGIRQGLVEANPVAGIGTITRRRARSRYLSEAEIRQLWKVLDRRLHVSSVIYKLMLLTACRPGEACALKWQEISEDGDWWTLPEERSKNAIAHRMFLAPLTRRTLDSIRKVTGTRPAVFWTEETRGEAIRNLQHYTAQLCEEVGFSFRPHDLRRTASTHLARLGVRDEIREAVLNHKKKGLRGVYNLYEYDREKQDG